MTNRWKRVDSDNNKESYDANSQKYRLTYFTPVLLRWFKENGRDLPWRRTRDPYKILVSEIMLQQTNVEIVIPIYLKFLSQFPSIHDLARAPVENVKTITDQLGYKRRGDYLHEIAKQIVIERDGNFPSDLKDLLSLKGIGRYTAGAILSFAFEKPAPIVDVNVERVLGRIFGLWDWEKNSKFEKKIWELSKAIITDEEKVWLINQGILDLGAMICIAQKPKCVICPMVEICEYYEKVVPKFIGSLDSFFSF